MRFKKFIEDLDPKLAYHVELNQKLWQNGEKPLLNDDVREHLTVVAKKFIETLKLPADSISDIVLTGSNANYNWTIYSDIDVHILVDESKLGNIKDCKIDIEDCLQAKKTLWNDRHDIEIYDHPVEVYVTKSEKLIEGSGTYSLPKNVWIKMPEKKEVSIDSVQIKAKAEEIAAEIDQMIKTQVDDENSIEQLVNKIWRMREAGLQSFGEFAVENLVFKALRNNLILK